MAQPKPSIQSNCKANMSKEHVAYNSDFFPFKQLWHQGTSV